MEPFAVLKLPRSNQNQIIIEPDVGGDIRVVVSTSCQSGCSWCHLESHKVGDEIGTLNDALAGWMKKDNKLPLIERLDGTVTEDDIDSAINIANSLNIGKIHLTGGEPTLFPNTESIIQRVKANGLNIGMTTHGEIANRRFAQIVETGLDSVNFSLHALTPEQYLALDLHAQQIEQKHGKEKALEYSWRRLKLKLDNIFYAKRREDSSEGRFSVKTNTVVTDASTGLDIVLWTNEHGIKCRLQKNLNDKMSSGQEIAHVIGMLGAYPVKETFAVGDTSGSSITYVYPAGERNGKAYPPGTFKVKDFGNVYIEPICGVCDIRGTDACREGGFYGIRLERGRIMTCIDRVNATTNPTTDEFIADKNGLRTAISVSYQMASAIIDTWANQRPHNQGVTFQQQMIEVNQVMRLIEATVKKSNPQPRKTSEKVPTTATQQNIELT